MQHSPRIIPRAEHTISRSQIDRGVLDVLYTLSKAGFGAYLVGGGIRDLLLGLEPKDFDVVTDATPEQVRGVFRSRCRIIGRRFRLAHVYAGDKVIEVATFRAHEEESGDRVVDDQGMLRRDNVYGTRDDDVWRRDFTINALYYNINDFSLVDYVGAMEDLQQGQLRLIGEPVVRYREDPVRMIRAVRFACKLGLELPQETAQPLPELAELLSDVSHARLFDEVLKLFHGGQGMCVFEKLRQHGLFAALFPQTDACLQSAESWSANVLPSALRQTDDRVASGKSVNPAFLFAVLLWEPLTQELTRMGISRWTMDAVLAASQDVLSLQHERTAVARPMAQQIQEIWALQLALEFKREKAERIVRHPRFRAAYDFLCLRALISPHLSELANWWEATQAKFPPPVPEPVADRDADQEAPSRRRHGRRRRR